MTRIDYFPLNPIAEAIGQAYETEHKGGGITKVVAVVAAVAIPIAAPAIASSLGVSAAVSGALGAAAGVVTTAGSVIGSAIVGAGLGAITAAVTGQDIKKGALMGGLSGGVSGYISAPTQQAQMLAAQEAAFTEGVVNPSLTAPGATATGYDAAFALGGGAPVTTIDPITGMETTTNAYGETIDPNTGQPISQTGQGSLGDQLSNTAPQTEQARMLAEQDAAFLGDTPAYTSANQYVSPGGMTDQQYMLAQQGAGMEAPMTTASTVNPPAGLNTASAPVAPPSAPPVAPVAATTVPKANSFLEAMKQVPSALANKFTDPNRLADLALQAGAQLAGQAINGTPPMSEAEQQFYDMQLAELGALKEKDEAAFQARLDGATDLLNQAGYWDPSYMAGQSANTAAISAARAKREAQRSAGLRTGRGFSAADERRFNLQAARNVGSAYDKGFQQGMEGQTKLTEAGLKSIPTASTTYMSQLANLNTQANKMEERRAAAAENTTDFLGRLMGTSSTVSDEDKQYLAAGKALAGKIG